MVYMLPKFRIGEEVPFDRMPSNVCPKGHRPIQKMIEPIERQLGGFADETLQINSQVKT
jgi:hypothetical protein